VLAAVGQTRTELRQELTEKINEIEIGSIDVLTAHVEGLQEQLDGKVDEHEFSGLRTEVNNELSAKVDATAFDTALAGKVDSAAFNAALATKVDESDFNSLQTEVNNELATKVDAATFDTALARKVDSATFTTRLSSLRGDINSLQRDVSRLSERVFPS